MKRHAQRSDIPAQHLNEVCRSSNPCKMLDFRSDEDGTRVITCSKGKVVLHPSPSDLNQGTQFTGCTGAPEYRYTQITPGAGVNGKSITVEI